MKICLVHNYYKLRGGEDQVFEDEAGLLESFGHHVLRFSVHNDVVDEMNTVALAKATIWNRKIYRKLQGLIRAERPEVVHFHNTLPVISPAAYYAVRSEGLPVIQTLHNYRLLCPGALFFRNGRVCEDCLGRFFYLPGIVHACYRGSRTASTAVTTMLAAHRAMRTWSNQVTRYIALTDFARQKFVEGGLPEKKILVKPNFRKKDPGKGDGRGGYALFVGRLSKEKGIETLLSAWEKIDLKLFIVGGGPMEVFVKEETQKMPHVDWLGFKSHDEVMELMKSAAFLVFPSTWYEGFPLTIIEAYATGTPVVTAKIGSPASVIVNNETGLHFQPGNADDLARKVEWIKTHPQHLQHMREGARTAYERQYTAERNYEMLYSIYEQSIVDVNKNK